jgi:hypothetical protein
MLLHHLCTRVGLLPPGVNPIAVNNNNFNLFTCKLNSPQANYKASTRRKNVHKQKQKNKSKTMLILLLLVIIVPLTQYNNNNNNNNNFHSVLPLGAGMA